MAKVVYIGARASKHPILCERAMDRLATLLTPDHIAVDKRTITERPGLAVLITSDSEAVSTHGASVAIGSMEASSAAWWKIAAPAPDGSFAIYRSSEEYLELVADFVGSRSIWYAHTPELFVASCSQRAIIACLGDFQPDRRVYPWMLASGSTGPDLAWDQRINLLRGDSRVVLDRRSWSIAADTHDVTFNEEPASDDEHEERLRSAVTETFDKLTLDWDRWVLALSGGYDSRCSLAMIEKHAPVQCITWGKSDSVNVPGTDAYIARRLATNRNHGHQYYSTDLSGESVERLFDRYLRLHDGRIDHIGAAMDGFERYRKMNEAGVLGLIRSDVGFSTQPTNSTADVRWSIRVLLLKDFANASDLGASDLEPQELPAYLERRPKETVCAWRDRLYHQFRLPLVQAALADARLGYMEQANPLLSRRVIRVVRALPDHLRNDKKCFKRIVDALVPGVPIAGRMSIAAATDLIRRPSVTEVLLEVLNMRHTRSLLPDSILNYARGALVSSNRASQRSRSAAVRRLLPKRVKGLLRTVALSAWKPNLAADQLALRCYIISRMDQLLREDARVLRREIVAP